MIMFIHYLVLNGPLGPMCLRDLEIERKRLNIGNSQIIRFVIEDECKLVYKKETSK